MADSSEASIPDEFFLRERIDLRDIRRVVPYKVVPTNSSVLKKFSLICQRTKRSQASWRDVDLTWGLGREAFRNSLSREERQETELALKNMTDSGLFASLQELTLYGDVFELWSKSRIPSTLQRLMLIEVEGEEQQTAIGKYLRSNDANLLESLTVKGSCLALATIIKSLGSGQVSTLRELCFQCYDSLVRESLAKILVQSLSEGAVNELRFLELRGSGFGKVSLSALAESSRLKNLETLRLSGMDILEDKSFVSSLPVDHSVWQNLQVLDIRPKYLAGSMLECIILLLESGKASSVANIIMGSFDHTNHNEHLIRIAKALEMQKLPSLQDFKLFGGAGSPCNMAHEISRKVQTVFLNAYQNNKLLTASLVHYDASQTRFVKTLRQYEERNKLNVVRMKILGNKSVPATYGKLFLCGSPRIGKTTLRRTLTRKNNISAWIQHLKTNEELATRGIEVEHMRFAAKGSHKRELELAVWDLAGQFEYEVLHSAFLPDLALADGQATFFLIVCSANADENSSFQTAQHTLLYWLKFIASSSSKLDLRPRHVSVVLNCFQDQQSGHDVNAWKHILSVHRKQFMGFLDLHPKPFVVNAQVKRQVKLLKKHIQHIAQESLLGVEVPEICVGILQTCHEWASKHDAYPVVSWEEYLKFFEGYGWSIEKLETATSYLHEAGHFILFKKLHKFKQSASEDQLVPEAGSTLVLDPEWLCKRVVGDLLLPEFLLNPGEKSIVLSCKQGNGSLRFALVAQCAFQIPEEKCPELMRIMERLGLGYTLPDNNQDIFIPALIKDDKDKNPPQCFSGILQNMAEELAFTQEGVLSNWVMGFSVIPKDPDTTLLPIAILRNLQVCLALDEDKGQQPDSYFKAGTYCISLKWQGTEILVEYNRDADNSQLNRLDVLVWPLVPSKPGSDPRSSRQIQVKVSQELVQQTLSIASSCCPGLELVTSVIKPWTCTEPFALFKERDVNFSVEQMKTRMQKEVNSVIKLEKGDFALVTNWVVGNDKVEYRDVLGEEDLRIVTSAFEEKSMYTASALECLGLMPKEKPPFSVGGIQAHPDAAAVETQDTDAGQADTHDNVSTISKAGSTDKLIEKLLDDIRRLESEVKLMRSEMHQGFDQLQSAIRGITEQLGNVIKWQISLNRYIHSLAFTTEDKDTILPRFLYLTKSREAKSAWVRLKDIASQEVYLHFMCEARHNDLQMHEVEGQLGVPVRYPKEWVKKVAPVLDWTLKIAVVAAKIANSVVLPGLDLIPDFTSKALGDVGQIVGGLGDLLSRFSESCFESYGKTSQFSPAYTAEAQEARRAAWRYVKQEVVGQLKGEEFEQQVGLWRVRILDGSGHVRRVGWICRACREKYRHLAIDMPESID